MTHTELEGDIVFAMVEGAEQTDCCPTSADDDEPLLVAEGLVFVVFLVLYILSHDGQILRSSRLRV